MDHLTQTSKPTMSSREIAELGKAGYVYACEYTGGAIKVGMSARAPRERIRCHDHTMRLAGHKRVGHYISHRIAAPRAIESRVIEELAISHVQKSREWLEGPCLGDVKEIVERLAVGANHPDAVGARKAYEERQKKALGLILDGVDQGSSSDSAEESRRFSKCMDLAERMEQVMRVGPIQDHENLDIVERGKYLPCSQFRLMAAIALFKSPDDRWDNLFSASVNDPFNLMIWVEGVTRHLAEEEGLLS